MAASKVQDLLENNKKYAASYTGAPKFSDLQKSSPLIGHATAVVSCTDPRVVPERFLGIDIGDMLLCRIAGGRARDALRSLLILQKAVGLERIVVVHHTDCGVSHFTDEQFKGNFEQRPELESIKFEHMTDFDASVKDDVQWLESLPFWSKNCAIVGLVFETENGKIRVVE